MRLTEGDIAGLEQVKQLIEAGYSSQNSIEHLASIAFLSKKKLISGYRKHFGLVLSDHLQCYRMLKAKQLLDDPLMPIKLVASACGFDFSCNFSTAFKKRFGVSPGKYRIL